MAEVSNHTNQPTTMPEANSSDNDTRWQDLKSIMNKRSVKTHAPHIMPYLRPNSRVLDVGCGGGMITIDIARLVPDGHVVGIDMDREAIRQAQDLARAANISNVEFFHGDATDLSRLQSASFDVVHSHQVLIHLQKDEGPVQCFKEMLRVVIAEGGVIATRDNADMFYVGGTRTMAAQREEFYKTMGADMGGGRRAHIWAHEAGVSWDKIEMGSVAWEVSGLEGRKTWASAAISAAKRSGYQDVEAFEKDMVRWAQNDAGRLMALDGWMIVKT